MVFPGMVYYINVILIYIIYILGISNFLLIVMSTLKILVLDFSMFIARSLPYFDLLFSFF